MMLAKLTAIEDAVLGLKGELMKMRESRESGAAETPRTEEGASPQSAASTMVSQATVQSAALNADQKMGIHARDDTTGGTVYLGRNSVPAFIRLGNQGNPKGSSSGGLGQDYPLQVFGLHNSTVTYPFAQLWSSQVDMSEIARALPSDAELMRYFTVYRKVAHRIYPVIADIDKFGMDVRNSMRERTTSKGSDTSPNSRWKNPSWMALLFATLASGTQFSDDPREERELSSRVFVCCSFQCLRIANFFIQPTTEQIQSLLLLGNCIRNDTNPGAAWILLGLTIRLAQSIGLHQKSSSLDPDTQELHRKIWWSVMWQDALLSFSYDRPHGAVTMDCGVPHPTSTEPSIHFMDLMYAFLRVVIDFSLHADVHHSNPPPSSTIQHFTARLTHIRQQARHNHLDQLERLTMRIHTGYIISQICRVVLRRPSDDHPDPSTDYTATCLEHSADVIHAFLEMHTLSSAIVRSWAFMHNVLSCALLLGLIPDALKKTETRTLLGRMIGCLEEIEADAGGECYAKSLAALKDIYESRVAFGGSVEEAQGELRDRYVGDTGGVGKGPSGGRNDEVYGADVGAATDAAAVWESKIMDSIIWGWKG